MKYIVKVNKVCYNKLVCSDSHAPGIIKMAALNLPVVRLQKQQSITKERKVLADALLL